MTRWTKDKLVEAFRANKKSIVIKWGDENFQNMTRDHVARLEVPEVLVEETPNEIIVFQPKLLRRL